MRSVLHGVPHGSHREELRARVHSHRPATRAEREVPSEDGLKPHHHQRNQGSP